MSIQRLESYESALSLVPKKFDFSLGYWRLYTVPMSVQMVTTHFADLPPHPPSARDLLSLPGDAQESMWILSHPVKENLRTIEIGRSVLRYVTARYPRYFIELGGTFDQYLQRFNRKRRGELRRKMRKFGVSTACFREYRSPEEMRVFYELALSVSRRSFQKRIGHGLPENPESVAQLFRLAQQQRIRGYLLFYEGRAVAFTLCHVNGSWLTGEMCGYDPSLSHLSPGNVLIACILELLFEKQEFRMLDLGTGEADYKAFFATGSVPCADVHYFRRNAKNIGLVAAHWTTEVAWRWTMKVLNFLHVRDKLKKLARHGWKKAKSGQLD